jgi:electron transfer flavoprotein-quinone oxidoreductase
LNQKFDAIVVGAGPAGCACGFHLAKAGLETLVVERGKFAGAKNMWGGAFYGPSLYELFPDFWEEAPVERYIAKHKYSLLTKDASFSVDFESPKLAKPPYNGFSVLRSKFDRWFAAKAEQAGAVVAAGLEAEDLLWEGNAVSGIKAGGDELPANVVIACDGVNSILAEKAGLRGKISPQHIKQGVKEIIQLPRQIIEQRFNLQNEEGIAWEFIGSFSKGIPGGAFIYTNKDSLSVGIVVQLNKLAELEIPANDLLEDFKRHPAVENLLADGQLMEYSAHLVPVGGKAMMSNLFTGGMLVTGDAAGLTLTTGLVLEGANFAMASGKAAAETVIRAKKAGDFSRRSLSYYPKLLEKNFVMKDLEAFKRAPLLLENPRFYDQYPELVCELAEKIFTNDGKQRKKFWEMFRESQKGRISLWRMISDLFQIKRAI